MSTIPMRPLGFGEIVDGAVQLYRRDFALYFLIVLVCGLPEYVLLVLWNPFEALESAQAVADDPGASAETILSMFAQLGRVFLLSLVGLILGWFAGLSLTVAMARRIDERPASLGSAFGGGLRRVTKTAPASILAALIFVVMMAVVWLLAIFVFVGSALAGPPALAVAGLLFSIALALIVIAFWFAGTFAIFPAVVVENRSGMDALERSFSLCRGGWLRVIGIMTVALIISSAPGMAITALTGAWDLFLSPGEVATVNPTRQWILNTANLLVTPLTLPFLVGCVMMLFHDRRVRREGYDLERRADDLKAAAP